MRWASLECDRHCDRTGRIRKCQAADGVSEKTGLQITSENPQNVSTRVCRHAWFVFWLRRAACLRCLLAYVACLRCLLALLCCVALLALLDCLLGVLACLLACLLACFAGLPACQLACFAGWIAGLAWDVAWLACLIA